MEYWPVGTDVTGAKSLAHGLGVQISGSSNLVGGTTVAARSLLVRGIFVTGGDVVQGNYIGTYDV